MALKKYNKIKKLLQEGKLNSLTVDVFDTVLLYDYWPSDLRYYDIAVRWLPTVNRLISPKITTYELYDWRMSAKRTLDQKHLPSRIDIWLDVMIDALCNKYNIDLDEEAQFEILTNLMAIELQFEISNTKPNAKLINQLAKIKEEFPKVKIYFVADSHFMSEQIKTMLDIRQIKIFDGGVSSADYNKSKASGELYEQLALEFSPNFDLATNLHIGDGRDPDFLTPSQRDSLAMHYRPIRLRGLRTLVGSSWMSCLKAAARHRSNRQLQSLHRDTSLIWHEYGLVLAEIHQAWAYQIQDLARAHDNDTVILAGSEAVGLFTASPQLQQNDFLDIAPELTKDNVLAALIWLLAAFDTERWDKTRLLQQIASDNQLSREDLYELCFTEDYNYSYLAINSFTEEDFWPAFLKELIGADKKYSAPARESYEEVAEYLPRNRKDVYLIQVPNDNLAELFADFAELHGVFNQIQGYNLDTANVLDADDSISDLLNSRRKQQIFMSIKNSAPIHSELSPSIYLEKTLLPAYRKITRKILRRAA